MKLTRLQLKNIIQEQVRELKEPDEEQAAVDAEKEKQRLGQKGISQQQQAAQEFEKAKSIRGGETMKDVDRRERAIVQDVDKILTAIAEEDDLNKYRPILQQVINLLRKKAGV